MLHIREKYEKRQAEEIRFRFNFEESKVYVHSLVGGRSVGQDKPKKVCLLLMTLPLVTISHCCRNERGAVRITCTEEQPNTAVELSTGAIPTVSIQILKQSQGRQMLYSSYWY